MKKWTVVHEQCWKNRLAHEAIYEEIRMTEEGMSWKAEVRCNPYIDQAYAKLSCWCANGWQSFVTIPMRNSNARVNLRSPSLVGVRDPELYSSPYYDAVGEAWKVAVEQMKLGIAELWEVWEAHLVIDREEESHDHEGGQPHSH